MIKKMYNPVAQPNSALVLTQTDAGCENCDTLTVCKYLRAGVAFATPITSITFISAKTGLSVVKTIGAYTTNEGLESLYRAAFESEGYKVEDADAIQVVVNASNAANRDHIFIGEANVTLINALATTVTCTAISRCTYTLTTGDVTAAPFLVDGVSTGTLTIDYTTDSAADVDTDVSALITGEYSVDVTKNSPAETFTIVVKHLNNKSFTLDGDPFVKSACYVDYV